MFDNSRYYVFDSHNRTPEGMCCYDNTGTSILLAFNTKSELEEYIKGFYLQQFQNNQVAFEVQYVKTLISEDSLDSFKNNLRSFGYIGKRKQTTSINIDEEPGPSKRFKPDIDEKSWKDKKRAKKTKKSAEKLENDRTRKANVRANETEKEKNKIRIQKANARANMTEEQREKIRKKDKSQKATAKANLTEEQKREKREKARLRMASARAKIKKKDKSQKATAKANLTEEQKREKREKERLRKANARAKIKKKDKSQKATAQANLTEEQKREKREQQRLRKANARANLTEEKKIVQKEKDRKRKSTKKAVLPFKNGIIQRVKTFKNEIRKGPFFICVICNRLLYKISVVLFDKNKYPDVAEEVFAYHVLSFDDKEYVCKTCHKKLLKNKVPCQAVANDLQIINLPERFSDIRKLEKIIIAKRILFKRITIMSKGQAPKMKGAICNVPIRADEICNMEWTITESLEWL